MKMNCPRKIARLALAPAFLLLCTSTSAFAQNTRPSFPTPTAPPPDVRAQKPDPSQQSQAPVDSQSKIVIPSTLVVIPVTVKDNRGNLVPDLKRDEFRIFEDNVEQKVAFFTVDAMPLSLVILIDNDLKKKDSDQVEPSLRSIVGGMSTSDEAFVCRFDQYFHEGLGFTRDQDKLITELRRTRLSSEPSVGPPGGPFNGPTINGQPAPGASTTAPATRVILQGQATKALDDAVYSAAELLGDRQSNRRRKVILLISDGQNGGSKFNTHNYDETLSELLRQGISVYAVATGSSFFERRFNRLREYTHDTGGDIYYGAKSNTFEDFYARITEQARNQYTLAFSPSGERKVDYHTLEVRVRREGLTILTRAGYYGGTFATEAPK